MFINIKLNLKTIFTICVILIVLITIYSIFNVFASTNSKSLNYNLIELNTQNYTNILKEIHMYTDRYTNHPIKGNGFIYIDETLNKNQFVLARNMIVCCESDPVIVGILCEYSGINDFEKNSWIEIDGIINTINKNGFNIPIVKINNIKKCKTPNNPTVTPPTI